MSEVTERVANLGVGTAADQASSTAPDPIIVARRMAEEVLFPRAIETDRADLVAQSNLDALAEAGLYGLFGPLDLGGFAADLPTGSAVVENIASGCLTTALVWLQHHGLVGNLQMGSAVLRDRYLADAVSGARRSGIVFAGLLPGPSPLNASRIEGGWVLTGTAPWVSGWGRINTLQIAARGPDDTVVTVVLDDLTGADVSAERHDLTVLNSSGTVKLTFSDVQFGDDHVISVAPHDPGAYNGLSLRLNGSLALGVARRCCDLLGPSPLDDQLSEVRSHLDGADESNIAEARARASAFASKAATTLLVHTGSRAIEMDQHAQRLAREAMFLLVFGSRPAIRSALLSYV